MACATLILPRMPTFMQRRMSAWFNEQEDCKKMQNYEEAENCVSAIF